MRWYPDRTGRFARRPYYPIDELDTLCEREISDLQKRRHGEVRTPVSTDDLTAFIEERTRDLDLYADLSDEGADIEGKTVFEPGELPTVLISKRLSEDPAREHRYRTTLAHEAGHVLLHRA